MNDLDNLQDLSPLSLMHLSYNHAFINTVYYNNTAAYDRIFAAAPIEPPLRAGPRPCGS